MSKLKTLKDLERKGAERYGMCDYCIERVRQEAIKHVKDCPCDELVDGCSTCEWIVMFSNIVAEDLK